MTLQVIFFFKKHTVSAKFCVLQNDKNKSVFLLCLTDECLQALGISDGRIDDSQLIASSVYHNDFMRFGPQRARLNTTSGYRAEPSKAFSSWMRVDIGRIVVVTAIATQGYGDEKTPEWVTSYTLLYSQGLDYTFFRDADGETQVRVSTFNVTIDGKISSRCTFSYHFYQFYVDDFSLNFQSPFFQLRRASLETTSN